MRALRRRHDGTIYQLVPLTTSCRHTVGLNWTAIGIEHVGTSDRRSSQPAPARGVARADALADEHYGIRLRNVIGHNESLTSPYHNELYAAVALPDPRRLDTPTWQSTAPTSAIAVRDGIRSGPAARPAESGC